MRHAVRTSQGFRVRNEDYNIAADEDGFYAVADGIGGAPFGDVMARVACASAHEAWIESGERGVIGSERLRDAFRRADEACTQVSEWLGEPTSGTTLIAVGRDRGKLYAASVGDSAVIYLKKEGGVGKAVGARRSPNTENTLLEALGYGMEPEPDCWVSEEELCDALLLCTDGVWENAEYEQLAKTIYGQGLNERKAVNEILFLSNGADNATAMVLVP